MDSWTKLEEIIFEVCKPFVDSEKTSVAVMRLEQCIKVSNLQSCTSWFKYRSCNSVVLLMKPAEGADWSVLTSIYVLKRLIVDGTGYATLQWKFARTVTEHVHIWSSLFNKSFYLCCKNSSDGVVMGCWLKFVSDLLQACWTCWVLMVNWY